MKYTEVQFVLSPLLPAREVLIAELAERGFDSFVETDNGLQAYIPSADYQEELLNDLSTASIEELQLSWSAQEMPDQNWNAEWEKNFDPIIVEERCLIRAPFHHDLPNYPLEVIIEPKMSFGTGHHSTTYLVIAEMMDMLWQDKVVLDMGSGTGVLAIAAEKMGSKQLDAIDIDEWAFENAVENCERNACSRIACIMGGAEAIPDGKEYDVILANINRNILLRDMTHYNDALKTGGSILFSGFYELDRKDIEAMAATFHWTLVNNRNRQEWCMLHFTK